MSLTAILSTILGPVIRPIIREELDELKSALITDRKRSKKFQEIDKESDELIEAAEKATTTEEVRAHLRKLRATRAKLN